MSTFGARCLIFLGVGIVLIAAKTDYFFRYDRYLERLAEKKSGKQVKPILIFGCDYFLFWRTVYISLGVVAAIVGIVIVVFGLGD
ncbi:MAG: hypothetical protein LBT23_05870 [Synergistaceae bacterium]|jgi:hypothetical protein|nr:hypothetical protein [Synergistaceae bacterium]